MQITLSFFRELLYSHIWSEGCFLVFRLFVLNFHQWPETRCLFTCTLVQLVAHAHHWTARSGKYQIQRQENRRLILKRWRQPCTKQECWHSKYLNKLCLYSDQYYLLTFWFYFNCHSFSKVEECVFVVDLKSILMECWLQHISL